MLTVTKQDDGLFAITYQGHHIITVRSSEEAQQAIAAVQGYRRVIENITGR